MGDRHDTSRGDQGDRGDRGNWGERNHGAGCTMVRELLSAVVDDEATGHERAVVDRHLDGCAACRVHAEHLAVLTRRVRLRPAEPVPELTTRVLDRARPPRLGRGGWIRPALAWVAVVLLAQSVGPLVFGAADGADSHVARHLGAFSAALGVGLLSAAWRPHRAFGLLPFAAALVVTMLVAALLDVAGGSSTLMAETVHLAEIVGLALLWLISGSPGLDRARRARGAPGRRLVGSGAGA
ncbi:MAG: zf-HC2 domain-containing protein [Ilumatobacteraceae bacterium]